MRARGLDADPGKLDALPYVELGRHARRGDFTGAVTDRKRHSKASPQRRSRGCKD